jgi:hypothetical protein
MFIQLQQLIKPVVGENQIDRVSDKLIQFVKELENDIKTSNDKGVLFVNIFKKILNLAFDLYYISPALSENEIEEITSRTFLFVYNNIFVPIDLPIPDYIEVILERTLEPILNYVLRIAVRTAIAKLKEVVNK